MKKNKIEIEFKEYDSIEELAQEDQELLKCAREAAIKAYSPYSGFGVGSAVVMENGEIIKGNNQENAAYPSGLCAERVALFYAAATFPNIPVKAIAISNTHQGDTSLQASKPCGACRQVISEYEDQAGSPIRIIFDGNNTITVVEGIDNLLPLRFKRSDLLPGKK
jgi:cytidine deaminase